jgi:hypothetical protein
MLVSKAHPDAFDIYNESIQGRFLVPQIAQQGGQPWRLRCNIAIFSESDGHNHTPELLHAAASQRFQQHEVRETGRSH